MAYSNESSFNDYISARSIQSGQTLQEIQARLQCTLPESRQLQDHRKQQASVVHAKAGQ